MHFEVPKAKSFKEFGGEYLMIVISILTALALEHGVQTIHHRHLAHEASVKIDAELRANIGEIGKVLAHNEDRKQKLLDIQKGMLAAIRSKISDAEWDDHFQHEWGRDMDISVRNPTLLHEAWDASLANQAVTYLSQAELERYASLYGNVRDMQSLLNGGAMGFLDAPRMMDVISDMKMGIAKREDMFRTVNQMISAYGSVDGNLENLQTQLRSAVARADHH